MFFYDNLLLVGSVVILRGALACTGIETRAGIGIESLSALSLLCSLCHILGCSVPGLFEFLVELVDISDVPGLDSLLEGVVGLFDSLFLLCGNLVTLVLEILVSLESHSVGGVYLVSHFLGSLVGFLIGLGLVTHTLHLFL